MRLKAFGSRQRLRRGADRAQGLGRHPRQRGALHEVEHREARGKPCRAGRGKDVVRPADIIADGLRCPLAEEHRAGMGDLGEERLGVVHAKLEVLGRDPVAERRRLRQVPHHDHRAVIAPGRARDGPPFQRLQAFVHRVDHSLAEGRVIGDQDRLCTFVMLRLAQEVDGDPVGVVLGIRDHEDFRGPRDHVDAHRRRRAAWPPQHRRCRGR
jgi:hypothetical protein